LHLTPCLVAEVFLSDIKHVLQTLYVLLGRRRVQFGQRVIERLRDVLARLLLENIGDIAVQERERTSVALVGIYGEEVVRQVIYRVVPDRPYPAQLREQCSVYFQDILTSDLSRHSRRNGSPC
jgi:hypothetical protein